VLLGLTTGVELGGTGVFVGVLVGVLLGGTVVGGAGQVGTNGQVDAAWGIPTTASDSPGNTAGMNEQAARNKTIRHKQITFHFIPNLPGHIDFMTSRVLDLINGKPCVRFLMQEMCQS
jgi:hypothetical protein